MKGRLSFDEFLGGVSTDKVEQRQKTTTKSRTVKQKVFRLPDDIIDSIRREALRRSDQTGKRVTETDIVIWALRAFLGNARQ